MLQRGEAYQKSIDVVEQLLVKERVAAAAAPPSKEAVAEQMIHADAEETHAQITCKDVGRRRTHAVTLVSEEGSLTADCKC